MDIKKNMLTAVLLIGFGGFFNIQAQQSIYVEKTNGSLTQIPLSQVQKISFSESEMIILNIDATTLAWELNEVQKYYFDITTDINNPEHLDAIKLIVYPNPSNGNFKIDYELNRTEKIEISLTNITGQVIDVLLSKEQQRGNYSLQWQNNDLSNGTYLIKVKSENNLTIKKLIILNR